MPEMLSIDGRVTECVLRIRSYQKEPIEEIGTELPMSDNFLQKDWNANTDVIPASPREPNLNDSDEEAQPALSESITIANEKSEEPPSDEDAENGRPEYVIEVRRFRAMFNSDRDTKDTAEHLNLLVPRGKIYGLIMMDVDPSWLLEFVAGVGPHQPQWIRVLGKVPGTPGASVPGPGIGYVSSEFPLYREHTVGEILRFVGKLHGMTEPHIEQRIESLAKSLGLPRQTCPVKSLYADDLHLVSIAAAMIHSPPVLIIEETSHFLNQATRWRIWNLLRRLTRNEGVTVLITSSNIEELQRADIVGFMRGYRIIEQDSPRRLLARWGVQTLQDVSLELYAEGEEEEEIHRMRLETGEIVDETSANCPGREEKRASPILEPLRLLKNILVPAAAFNSSKGFTERSEELLDSLCRIFMLFRLFPSRGRNEWVTSLALIAGSFSTVNFMISPRKPASGPEDVLDVEGELSAAEYMRLEVLFSFILVVALLRTMLERSYRDYVADRCLIAGRNLYEIAASSMIAHFCAILIPTILILCTLMAYLIYSGSPNLRLLNPESLTLVWILCLLQAFQGVAFGMLVTIRWSPPHFSFALTFMWGILNIFPSRLLDAELFPLLVQAQFFPVKAFRGIIHHGWGIMNHEVLIGLSCSLAWSAIFAYFAIRVTAVSNRVRFTV